MRHRKSKLFTVINTTVSALTALALLLGCSEQPHSTTADSTRSHKTVSIIRDDYGVPHIFAEDNYGVFFGYGHAVAQDRLFQLEMLKRTVQGRVAEVLGQEYVEFDRFIRSSYDSRSVPAQVAALPPEEKALLQAYADGINQHLETIRQNADTLMPKEFLTFGFEPAPWHASDVAMLFAGSIAHRYSDFNTEIDNLQLLQSLEEKHGKDTAWRIFSATKWLFDANSPTTVPAPANTAKTRIPNPDRPHYLDQLTGAQSGSAQVAYHPDTPQAPVVAPSADSPLVARQFAATGTTGTPGFGSASNLWMINSNKVTSAPDEKSVNGQSVNGQSVKGALINGPQFGWSTPSYVYGIGLHGGDFDLVGNTLLALPALLFAHNNHIGWGSTAGFGDQVDMFREQLNPDNAEQYFHNGQYRDFDRWQETIAVKDAEPVVMTVRRSVHGMIQTYQPEQGIAFARARTWEGKEVDSLMAWIELAKVKDIQQVQPVLERIATNINFYIMDKHGNMRYRHGGHYPRRAAGHDTRLPVPGTGEYDWQGMRPGSDNPSVFNPEQGYLVNWNNRPARNWQSPDLWWMTWSRGDRADVLIDELEAQTALTPEQAWAVNSRSSFADVNLAYLRPYLAQAMAAAIEAGSLSDTETQAWQALESWDGYWWDRDQDGAFDGPGPVIFEAWLSNLLTASLQDDVGEKHYSRFAPTGQPTVTAVSAVNLQPGTKALLRNLDALHNGEEVVYDFFNGQAPAELMVAAFRKAVTTLSETQGSQVANWHNRPHPLVFRTTNFRGIPQALEEASYSLPVIQNRGSENNLFIAKGTHIEAWDVFGPGQSGFIAPNGQRSAHHQDQLALYQSFGKKKLAFSREELVPTGKETRVTIQSPAL